MTDSLLQNHWILYLHITTAVIGELIFVVAFGTSCIYLHTYNKLKQKVIDHNLHPTSLSKLEKFVVRASVVGLIFITTSLVSGLLFLFTQQNTSQIGLMKLLWAFCVWGWYLLAIFGRRLWGWRGRKGARLIIFGMILLIFGLFGILWPQ